MRVLVEPLVNKPSKGDKGVVSKIVIVGGRTVAVFEDVG
jgi:hypothetical protein